MLESIGHVGPYRLACMNRTLSLLVALIVGFGAAPAAETRYDVVVYGGTSGGVVAAVQAARCGRTVVLVSPTAHLGGLTSNGLGWTDLGSPSILGGLNRQFYHEVYLHYQEPQAWAWEKREEFGNAGQGMAGLDAKQQIASVFEPKVAEAVFQRWIEQAKVPVVRGRLDLRRGVVMDGARITALRLEDGREIAGSMFIDASYEGDLLPGARVTFTVGREANNQYGESVNGIQAAKARKNQLPEGIDPYRVKGDPASGLLPGVNADAGGADGSADARLQAYCYRMVLTDVPANRVMIEKPADYDERDYEILFRAIDAGQQKDFFKLSMVPNRKTDSNNASGISTDFIGMNYGPGWDWTTLGHAERDALAKRHESWQRGLVWTLQNHPRVPEAIRKQLGKWGLAADEFADNGHWPRELYVREARRMVSDVVMSEQHCLGKLLASDPVAMAAYAMDSHNTQRIVQGGMVRNEGDIQLPAARPYPISYRAIVPRRGECPNLLVPWSLSASHMAFGSIRMEPVFMALGQAAALAGDLALARGLAVQEVSYAELRPRLEAAGVPLGAPQPVEGK